MSWLIRPDYVTHSQMQSAIDKAKNALRGTGGYSLKERATPAVATINLPTVDKDGNELRHVAENIWSLLGGPLHTSVPTTRPVEQSRVLAALLDHLGLEARFNVSTGEIEFWE